MAKNIKWIKVDSVTGVSEDITKEAKIAGVRGLYSDRIDGIMAGIDTSTVAKALESYAGIHTSEKIGERTIGSDTEDVNVGYYNPSGLPDRYEFS